MRSLDARLPQTIFGVRGQEGIIATATAIVGGLLALKRPGNRVSWLILGSGVAGSLQFVGSQYAIAALAVPVPGAAAAAWIGGIMWVALAYVVFAVALGSAVAFAFFAVYPGRLQQLPYDNRFGVPAPAEPFAAASTLVVTLFALGAILALTSLVIRYRVSGGEVRQQLKWLVVAGFLAAVTEFLAI